MYVLRSKKTGIDCGWAIISWKTGAFEIVDDGSGLPTPTKVIAGIEKATGINLTTSAPAPAPVIDPLAQPEPVGMLVPAGTPPVTTVTDEPPPATVPPDVPTDVFTGAVDAEDNT